MNSTPQTPDPIVWLQQMVRTSSIHPVICGDAHSEQTLAQWVADTLEKLGLHVTCLPVDERGFQVLVTIEPTLSDQNLQTQTLLFDSHLDTVGVAGMSIDPFGGTLQDGKIWGRGACDTKGTGAALMAALCRYAHSSDRPNRVYGLFSIGEEAGMDGIRHFCLHNLPNLTHRPDLAIVGEPTELAVLAAHFGALRLRLEIQGKACHSSIPHEGANALYALASASLAIEALGPALPECKLCGQAACNITQAEGGISPNVIPDRASATIDRRLAPDEAPEEALAQIKEVLHKALDPRPDIDFTLHIMGTQPGLPQESAASAHQPLRKLIRQHGPKWPLLGATYCTHAGHLHAAGIPCVVCGPGGMHKAHQADEWVDASQIYLGAEVYTSIMAMPPHKQ